MKKLKLMVKILLPFLILGIGILTVRFMVLSRKPPQKAAKEAVSPLVEVYAVRLEDREVTVPATGTVEGSREIAISPQVGGVVVAISPKLVTGGFFGEGELLFAVEAEDYALAVERARAALVKAETDLALTTSRAEVARVEWERLHPGKLEPENPLVLLKPQVEEARASLLAATAALKQAQLDLARTEIHAPFDCRIRSEKIDIGIFIQKGAVAAELVATDTAEVVVPLPYHELHWLAVPRAGSDVEGSKATVSIRSAGRVDEWQGRIIRSHGEVDPKNRMIKIVIQVDDPYNLKDATRTSRMELATGLFVEVALHGKILPQAALIPRGALRENNIVWTVAEENMLSFRKVSVAHAANGELLIDGGLHDDDMVVLTDIPGAAEGMKLRMADKGEQP